MEAFVDVSRGQSISALLLVACLLLASCSTVRQYPDDPGDTSTVREQYEAYFASSYVEDYLKAPDATQRQATRDVIIYNRMIAYDIAYGSFKRRILLDGNAIATGGDLLGLVLTGLVASTGNAATKSALGAAAAGVLGAKTAINTDLFYQRTLPALLAQMDANRARSKLQILNGLGLPDDRYPLAQGLVDLEALRDAGGIPGAIEGLTSAATADKQQATDAVHGAAFKARFATRSTHTRAIENLSGPQVLVVMAQMDPHLSERAPDLQAKVKKLDPNGVRLKIAEIARPFLENWADDDDGPDAATLKKFDNEWDEALVAAARK